MEAIIYTTNTGSAEQYAKILAQETGLPAYSMKEAQKKIRPGADVICLGWIMAGTIKGYSAAVRHYQVQAVCAVGMGRTGTQTDAVRKKNCIPGECPLFTIQGNFDVNKLHGMYRMMMELMIRTAGKALAGKKDRTAEEDDMLDMMLRGGERVRRENLMEVLEWYHLQEYI